MLYFPCSYALPLKAVSSSSCLRQDAGIDGRVLYLTEVVNALVKSTVAGKGLGKQGQNSLSCTEL